MKRALAAAALLLLVFAKKNDSTDGLRVYGTNGDSMEPTIHAKERILLDELAYTVQRPQRGDIIAYRAPDRTDIVTIKRVVGLPFETVELRKNKLFINGRELGDPGAHLDATKPPEDFGPVTLKAAEYFVLGDNRGHSYDSRQHGAVLLGFILGHVLKAAGEGGVRLVK
ncbi:MAG TPA: signal peptidase I [Thermoanaerobaculia bacterium]